MFFFVLFFFKDAPKTAVMSLESSKPSRHELMTPIIAGMIYHISSLF